MEIEKALRNNKENGMNEQKQKEAMARLDGLTMHERKEYDGSDHRPPSIVTVYSIKNGHTLANPPDYDSDNELDRMVRGLDAGDALRYCEQLHAALCEFKDLHEWDAVAMIQATPAQKREAFLKAAGEWE